MELMVLELVFYEHFKSLSVGQIIVNNWMGHLLYLEWDGKNVDWDLLFINSKTGQTLG